MQYNKLGATKIKVAPIIFGTSSLGNLYQALSKQTKLQIVKEFFNYLESPLLDSAGKYGAGLALEVIGQCLKELAIESKQITISNKLGWQRTRLTTPEPKFEAGVWKDLEFDAKQSISYNGIIECWEQGCQLLGEDYTPQMLSVHDPDEYLALAHSADERKKRFEDILEAYRALNELKKKGYTKAVGVGAKDWQVIKEIETELELDWIMFANSYTIFSHPQELLKFMQQMDDKKVGIINSAVFHSGFLIGTDYFDYIKLDPDDPAHKKKYNWREKFFRLCKQYEVSAAMACIQFGLSPNSVCSISLNTSRPDRVKQNIDSINNPIPQEFWEVLKLDGLISRDYPYLG